MKYCVNLVQRLYQTVPVEADYGREAADLAHDEADPDSWKSDGIVHWNVTEAK